MLRILVGFVVGYVIGARDGRQRFDQIRDACTTIAGSDEFKNLMSSGSQLLTSGFAAAAPDGRGRTELATRSNAGEIVGGVVAALVSAAAKGRKAA